MKNLTVILSFLFASLTANYASAQGCSSVYWEQLSDSVKNATIASNEVSIDAVAYYKGNLKITDNERSFRLFDILTSEPTNKNIRAFYFYLFNTICTKSDGAISEVLGDNCQKVLINNPVYVLSYFSSHDSIMNIYARLLGSELYFKQEGTSRIMYNFNDFKKLINDKLGANANLQKIFNDLNSEIEKIMKNMN